ncbi:MAG: plastocyanin/azurin family copper-binding protein [Candidatus Thermoplasmatota archaeon]|nr:plastocyanin/azurin family copper-binding protein [Candidatus Thermoplasmatota archaeon]
MRHRFLILTVVVTLLSFSTSVTAQDDDVIIGVDSTNLQFSPSDVTIKEGQAVRFFWSGELLPHNAVASDGIFDSGEPSRNVDYRFVFEPGTNGTYEFVCEPHEQLGMVGTITVLPNEDAQPEPEEPNTETSESTEEKFRLTFFGLELIILSFIAFLVYQVGKARERGIPLFVKGDENEEY